MNAQLDTTPLATVQKIYEAFGQGDIPTILEALSPDVEWEYGMVDNDVPWLQKRRGRDQVGGFFVALMQGLRITAFRPKELLLGQAKVVALIDIEGQGLATGRGLAEEDEVHIWHFDAQGLVCRFRHAVDTLQHQRVAAG